MFTGKKDELTRSDISALKIELLKEKYKQQFRFTLRKTLFALVVFASVAVLISMLWLPVLRIFGDSGNTTVGCISEEQMVGKIVFCIWPLPQFGGIGGGR